MEHSTAIAKQSHPTPAITHARKMIRDDGEQVMEAVVGGEVSAGKLLLWYLLEHCMTTQQHLAKRESEKKFLK